MIIEIFLCFIALYLVLHIFKPKGNPPPGPIGLPFFGTYPYGNVEECIRAREKYGDIFMIKAGAVKIVYICDFKLAKEALTKLEFADRPQWGAMKIFEDEQRKGKSHGIIFSNGSHWVHNRRFLLRHLRDLGMGKSKIEGTIMRETEELVEDFKKLTKEPSELPFSINVAILNIIWQLIASHRYDFKDKEVEDFMDNIGEIQSVFMLLSVPYYFPIVKYLLPKQILHYLIGMTTLKRTCRKFEEMLQPFIDDHLKTLDVSNPRDLMDDYLIEMKEGKSEDYSHFDFTDLTKITFDLFVAGNDTTGSMVRWFIIYMARFPEVQEKIQEDIDRVVSKDTLPGLQHRNELVYLDAAINEVQRHCSMVAMGVFRSTTRDVKLGGYDIPKGTAVLSIATLSHKDPAYFKDPEKFDPCRFIDKEGKLIATKDGFQAFGIGKRQCLGEQFARMELYLIGAALLQNFTFAPPEGEGEMSLAPDHTETVHFPRRDQKFSIKCRN